MDKCIRQQAGLDDALVRDDMTLVEKKGPESTLRSDPDTSIRQLGDLGQESSPLGVLASLLVK